jgi:uncharacterized protein DUF5946
MRRPPLTGMYAALEEGRAAESNRAVQLWLNGPQVFPRPDDPAPRKRGALTILHVLDAIDPDDHVRRVREWALSTWEAWRSYHHLAQQWVEQAGRRWLKRKAYRQFEQENRRKS